ncbi:MAG: T9SS type A sorting domain-containing protein [Calditrichaeota bacterium]|nr:T9SS type A sorting domain-containing protein [Calditrichota bacterium]
MADGSNGLRIIDVSDPVRPQEVGFFDTGGYAVGIYVNDSYVYVADGGNGLRIIDVSDPVRPQDVGYFSTSDQVFDVHVNGDYAFVANRLNGLRVIDVSDPARPKEVGYFNTGDMAKGVYISNDYVFVADGYDGVYILKFTGPTGIENDGEHRQEEFALHPNYPNPFNPTTTIRYALPRAGDVTLVIYNSLGQKVHTLVNRHQPAGRYTVQWDGRDKSGRVVPAGIYFYSLKVGQFEQMRKMVLVR